MALSALRDHGLCGRRMALMAVKATQCGAVGTTFLGYLQRRIDVTLDAIRIFKGNLHDLRLDRLHTH
jgi:hypothetical protein